MFKLFGPPKQALVVGRELGLLGRETSPSGRVRGWERACGMGLRSNWAVGVLTERLPVQERRELWKMGGKFASGWMPLDGYEV